MIAGFFAAMLAGHIYLVAIITAVQIISFKEVIAIANVPSRARSLRFTKSLNWYFLATAMYYLDGESVIYYFKHIVLVEKVLLPLATHHRFISFMLYIFGMNPVLLASESRKNVHLCHNSLRLCLFRRLSAEGPLPIPVYPICVDSYGSLFHSRTVTLHHEQPI